MKKVLMIIFAIALMMSVLPMTALAKDYTDFNIVFEQPEGANVINTEIKVFASISGDKLQDRTSNFTLEGVAWYKYFSSIEAGKTIDDYDYVDEELNIYGYECTESDIFEHGTYKYFLRISNLYADEEDTFDRSLKINGVDIDEMNGICWNAGNAFTIKTVTNGFGGSSEDEPLATDENPGQSNPSDETNDTDKHKCKVCGICPIQPLGICLFIWIAIIVIAVIAIIIIVSKISKKEKKEEKDEKEED